MASQVFIHADTQARLRMLQILLADKAKPVRRRVRRPAKKAAEQCSTTAEVSQK
jgi:hypothetical protein